MDAVGDPQDGVIDDALPGLVGRLGVQVADGVRPAGQAQREGRHVELGLVAVHGQAELEELVDRDPALLEQRSCDAPDEVAVEPLVAGRDRRVDREHAVLPDVVPGVVEGHPRGDVLARTLGQQERRVALVQVPDRGRQAQRPDRADAADAQDELLVEPHLASADVQDVGDRPVGVGILGHVRVEEQHRDPADLGDPDRDEQVPTRAARP